MKNLIERIMVIDRTAKAKLEEAERKKEQTMKEIQARKEQLNAQMEQKARLRLSNAEESEKATADLAVAEINDKVAHEKKRLQDTCAANEADLVQLLIADIIPRSEIE